MVSSYQRGRPRIVRTREVCGGGYCRRDPTAAGRRLSDDALFRGYFSVRNMPALTPTVLLFRRSISVNGYITVHGREKIRRGGEKIAAEGSCYCATGGDPCGAGRHGR